MSFNPYTLEIGIDESSLDDIDLYDIQIIATLDDRRQSETSMTFTLEVKCIPYDFSIQMAQDVIITVGDPDYDLPFTLSEAPCNYGISYEAVGLRDELEPELTQPLPAFILFNAPQTSSFTIESPHEAQVGTYVLKLIAQLQDAD